MHKIIHFLKHFSKHFFRKSFYQLVLKVVRCEQYSGTCTCTLERMSIPTAKAPPLLFRSRVVHWLGNITEWNIDNWHPASTAVPHASRGGSRACPPPRSAAPSPPASAPCWWGTAPSRSSPPRPRPASPPPPAPSPCPRTAEATEEVEQGYGVEGGQHADSVPRRSFFPRSGQKIFLHNQMGWEWRGDPTLRRCAT